MIKKIIFRADGNSKVGLGHLYRVFALFEMLKENYECILITRSDSELRVIPKSYDVIIIPVEVGFEEEPNWLSQRYEISIYTIIADGYGFDADYQKEIKKIGYKLIYIDDLATYEMHADVVINHSLAVKPKSFIAKPNTLFGLGSKYAMLRPRFIEVAKKTKQAIDIERVFVSFGGADFHDLTYKAVEALTQIKSIIKIHVLIGAAYKHQNIYKIKKENTNIIIHKNLPEAEVLKVMERAQLAIIPSSTISYEVCSVKMLAICGYFADNQKLIYNGLNKKKVIYPAGDYTKYDILRFKNVIIKAIGIGIRRQNLMLENQRKLFDGNQKTRFLKIINS